MKIPFPLLLLLISIAPAAAQPPDALSRSNTETVKCRDLLKKTAYAEAETICRSALALALALPARKKAERLAAYENYGLGLYFQEKYESAELNFKKALDFGQSLPAHSPAVGNVYFNLGRTNQKMEELDRAEEYFLAAENVYRKAYLKTASRKLKKDYRDYIGTLLMLRSAIASQLGDVKKQKEIQTAIKGLSRM